MTTASICPPVKGGRERAYREPGGFLFAVPKRKQNPPFACGSHPPYQGGEKEA